MLLLNFGFDDDGCCDDSSIENAVYMARRRRTVRCGARTRTDRDGRYMLVYNCRRAGVVPARTTLARAPTTPFYSPRRPTTRLDSGATVDSNHQETFSLFLLFFFVLPTSTSSCRCHHRRHHFTTPHKQLHEHTRARTPHVVPIILLCTRHVHGRDSRESPR